MIEKEKFVSSLGAMDVTRNGWLQALNRRDSGPNLKKVRHGEVTLISGHFCESSSVGRALASHANGRGFEPLFSLFFGDVTQLVEFPLCKRVVRGSSPLISIVFSRCSSVVEQLICNQLVGGSNPFSGSFRAISSAGSEQLPYKQRVGGSNPSSPITILSWEVGLEAAIF